MKAPLVIVGGGLVGAALALALERRGLAVQLVEPQPPSDARVDPRTVALSPASIDLLRTLGAWTDELPGACAYRAMDVWDAGGTGRIRFEAEALGVRSLGTIVPNGSALARLWARLAVRGVETITGAGVTALERLPGVTRLTLADERVLQTPLAIAADGGRSALRGFAGVPVRTTAMGQVAIATTAIVERPHGTDSWIPALSRFCHWRTMQMAGIEFRSSGRLTKRRRNPCAGSMTERLRRHSRVHRRPALDVFSRLRLEGAFRSSRCMRIGT